MNASINAPDDVLGLGELPEPRPDSGSVEKDWAVVSAAMDAREKRRRQTWIGSLAAAASVALVIAIARLPGPDPVSGQETVPQMVENPDSGAQETVLEPVTDSPQPGAKELMSMSQGVERQLRLLRTELDNLPPEYVVYQVELQDLIGQVDDALSLTPDSRELWGQRLGLQMDLMKLYRSHLRRDYSGLASL